MKKRFISLLSAVIVLTSLIPTVSAASESDLISKLRQHTSEPIAKTYYEDFNGDGKREMFAFTGSVNNDMGYDIVSGWVWFVSEDNVVPVTTKYNGLGFVLNCDFAPEIETVGNTKFFRYQSVAGNGNYYTFVCKVTDDNTVVSTGYDGYLMKRDGVYVINYSFYDTFGGRFYHDYWYFFDEESESFKEYGAIEITKEQFLKYKGADKILAGIDGDVVNILYRGNGIININVSKYYDEEYSSKTNILVGYDSTKVWEIDRGNEIYPSSTGHYQNILNPFHVDYPVFEPDRIKVTLNGNEIEFDQQPVMAEGDRVMVPIRAIFEALGYKLEWDQKTETATAAKGMNKLVVKVGLSGVHFNNEWIPFDVPNTNEAGRVRVPVRVVSECAGAKVDWDGETKTVILKK